MTMEVIKENQIYKTSDLATATVISLYFPLQTIERTPGSRKAFFVFERKDGLDEILERFYRREEKVEAYSFFEQLSFIKSRLYAEE